MARHNGSIPTPNAVIGPTPVTTTRRVLRGIALSVAVRAHRVGMEEAAAGNGLFSFGCGDVRYSFRESDFSLQEKALWRQASRTPSQVGTIHAHAAAERSTSIAVFIGAMCNPAPTLKPSARSD